MQRYMFSFLLLLTLFVPSFAFSSPPHPRAPGSGLHVPLSRRGPNLATRWDGDADLNVLFTMVNCTRVKYNYTSAADCSTLLPANSTSRRSLLPRQSQGNTSLLDQVCRDCYQYIFVASQHMGVAFRVSISLTMLLSVLALRELCLLIGSTVILTRP